MSSKTQTRKRLYVDRHVQLTLILRVVVYWILCLTAVTNLVLCWRVLTGPPLSVVEHFRAMWLQFGAAMLASLVVLPLVAMDIIRLSNRFVGPLVRLRRAIRALARGEHVEPVSFREGDFWLEIAQEFNALLARVQRNRRPASPDEGRQSELVGTAAE